MSQYRDPLAGLISQVATKRAAAADMSTRVSAVVRAMLPDRIASALETLTMRAAKTATDLATLTDVDAALDALLVAYGEALALAPALIACSSEPPAPPQPGNDPPWLIEERAIRAYRGNLDARLQVIAPGAYLKRWGDFAYTSRFSAEGIALTLVTRHWVGDTNEGYESALLASLPRALPDLDVRREHAWDRAAHALGLAEEVELHDDVFDRAFWVKGDAATATLLVPAVRRALLAMVHLAPALHARDACLDLRWRGDIGLESTHELLPDAAIDTVVRFRRALASG